MNIGAAFLPPAYQWLAATALPPMLAEAVKLLGTIELPGDADSPAILAWGKEIGLERVYSRDAIPWCGLLMAVAAKRAGETPPKEPLWARNWQNFGRAIERGLAMLGDVLTFKRGKGGHVAIYVGEDRHAFHILGGNQSDSVSIVRKGKAQLLAVSRPLYPRGEPVNIIRKFALAPKGALSQNEV